MMPLIKLPLSPRANSGLTILEVLIALSIFALIGVASYRMLSSVIDTQQITKQHSLSLGQIQKAMLIMDRDMEQIAKRNIRTPSNDSLAYLLLNKGDYKLELTRMGWRNPLQLSRSSMQRVAYDVGLHPDRTRTDSVHFGDDRQYLLRHYWRILDRNDDAQLIRQPLLADIESIDFYVVSEEGKHNQWPIDNPDEKPASASSSKETQDETEPVAIGFSMQHTGLGKIDRLFRIN